MDHLRFLCLVFLMLLRLFITALWSSAGKRLTSWLLLVIFIVFLLLSHVIRGSVKITEPYLITFESSKMDRFHCSYMSVGLKAPAQPSCCVPTYRVYFFKFILGGDFS